MDDIDAIRLRLRISKLEAQVSMKNIEAAALAREIRSPLTFTQRREQAALLREALREEISAISADLNSLREQFPDLARH